MPTLKCTLKKEAKDGTIVYLSRRTHKEPFILEDVAEDSIPNIKRFCDVEVIDNTVKKEAVSDKSKKEDSKSEKEKAAEKELLDFASASWELAVSQKNRIEELEELVETQAKTIKDLQAAQKKTEEKKPRKRTAAKK